MDKFKTTIYLPIGYQNTDLSSEVQLVRYIQKTIPREFRVTQVIDTYIENNHSAVTVEVEKSKDAIEITKIVSFLEDKIKESKSNRLKQELKEIIEEITGMSSK